MGLCDFIGKEKTAPAIVSSLPFPLQSEAKLTAINEEKHNEEEKHEEEAAALSCLCCYLCLFGLVSS